MSWWSVATARLFNKLVANSGARFSETGYGALVQKAEVDDALAEKVGQRIDIPKHLHRQLISREQRPSGQSRCRSLLRRPAMKFRTYWRQLQMRLPPTTERPREFTLAEQLSKSCTVRENLTTQRS